MLATNAGMLNLARRATDHVTVEREGDTYLVTMLFEG
jgi:hypothetical protein